MLGSRSLGPAVATIDLGALRHNAAEASRLAGGRAVIGVVKADAYGHGAAPVARALCEAGIATLATWSVGEAAALLDAGIEAPLLALAGPRDDAEADEAVGRGIACVLGDPVGRERLARAASRQGREARAHVEIDTGMRRMGAPPEEGAALAAEVAATPGLVLAGVMTHFARADEADLGPTREQLEVFHGALAALRARGVDRRQNAEQDREFTEERRISAESARREAEQFRQLAEEAREIRD
jgi:alanine racemase